MIASALTMDQIAFAFEAKSSNLEQRESALTKRELEQRESALYAFLEEKRFVLKIRRSG